MSVSVAELSEDRTPCDAGTTDSVGDTASTASRLLQHKAGSYSSSSRAVLTQCHCRSLGAVDTEHFRQLVVENAVEKAEERMMATWFTRVTQNFSGDTSLMGKIPNSQMASFFNCVSTLLTNQAIKHDSYLTVLTSMSSRCEAC